LDFKKISYILENWAFLRISNKINYKRNQLKGKNLYLAKEKVKEMIAKKIMTSGKQLNTIMYPQTNHTIVYHACSWTIPLKNYLNDVF